MNTGPSWSAAPALRHNIFVALILLILVLAGLFRFYHLGQESLAIDEVYSARAIQYPWGQLLHHIPRNKPPLDYAIQKFFDRFGAPEFWHRFHTALAGVALAFGVYVLAAGWFGRRIALAAFALAACSPYLVDYSQEARPYSLFCALAVWQQVLLGRWWRGAMAPRPSAAARPGDRRLQAGILILSWLALATLYAAALLFLMQALFLLLAPAASAWGKGHAGAGPRPSLTPSPWRVGLRMAGRYLMLVGAALLLALPLAWRPRDLPPDLFIWDFQSAPFRLFLDTIGEYLFHGFRGTVAATLAVLALGVMALGIAEGWRISRPGTLLLGLCSWLVFPPIFLFYRLIGHSYASRYTIFIVPGLLVFLALGLWPIVQRIQARLFRRRPPTLAASATLLLLVAVYGGATLWNLQRQRPLKLDWRGFARYLTAQNPGAARVVLPSDLEMVPLRYYLDRLGRADIETLTQKGRLEDSRPMPTWEVSLAFDPSGRLRSGQFKGFLFERLGEGPAPGLLEAQLKALGPDPTVQAGTCPAALLGDGWGQPEAWGPGFTVRWVTSKRTHVYIPLGAGGAGRLSLKLMPHAYPGAPPQSVELTLEGRALGRRDLPRGQFTTVELNVPPGVVHRGFNRLELVFSDLHSPSLEKNNYGDFRMLAAAVQSISWQRGQFP